MWWSADRPGDRLDLEVLLEAGDAVLTPDPAFLVAAEGDVGEVGSAAVKHWFSDLYANIDAMRLDEFVAGLAPDVELVVGNNPAMHGRQAAKRSHLLAPRV